MKNLTAITGTPSTTTFGQQSQQTTITVTTNPRYPRQVILSTQGVRVTRGSVAAAITISDLVAAMAGLEPTLTYSPLIIVQPVSFNCVLPSSASFSVTAQSEFPSLTVTYEWFYSTDNGATFNTCNGVMGFTGALTATLDVTNAQGLNGYQFYCKCTNVSGTTQTVTVFLNVNPDITTEPSNLTVTAPAAASFTVVANGIPAPTYQWQISNDSGATWSNLTNTGVYTNVTTATMNISNSTGLNGKYYRCLVTNSVGTSTTTNAILTVM